MSKLYLLGEGADATYYLDVDAARVTMGWLNVDIGGGKIQRLPLICAEFALEELVAVTSILGKMQSDEELPVVRLWDIGGGRWQIALVFTTATREGEEVPGFRPDGSLGTITLKGTRIVMAIEACCDGAIGKKLMDDFYASDELVAIEVFEKGFLDEAVYGTVATELDFERFAIPN